MKESKNETRSPVRSVVLKIRDCQVTVKVKSAVPQVPSSPPVRPLFR